MAIPRQCVVAKIEHEAYHPRLGANRTIPKDLVIRKGFCDFTNDGQFNSTNEIVVITTQRCTDIIEIDQYWNSGTESFQNSAP